MKDRGMPLEIRIARSEFWLDSEKDPIPMADWQRVVDSHPLLERRDVVCARNPVTGDKITVPLRKGAVMQLGDDTYFFSYDSGHISVSCSENALPFLRGIAHSLRAKLQNEDGQQL